MQKGMGMLSVLDIINKNGLDFTEQPQETDD